MNYEIIPLPMDLPAYLDADIDKNQTAWTKAFEVDGKCAALLAGIKGKFTLTKDQEARIIGMGSEKVNTETGEVTQATEGESIIKVTEKDLEEKLNAAESPAQVDAVLSLINNLSSKAAQSRIVAKASARKTDFEG